MPSASTGNRSHTALDNLLSVMDARPTPAPAPDAPPTTPQGEGWGPRPEAKPAAPPTLRHPTVVEFFVKVVRPMYVRKVGPRGSRRWSAQWWQSKEAVARMEALWRSWEHSQSDAAMGLVTWFHEADYHMDRMLSPEGPFALSKDETQNGQQLPHADPPKGMFTPAQAEGGRS